MTSQEFNSLVLNRRSIRRYTDEAISADHVKLIMESALMAPTSKNSHSTRFILVDDKATLKKMSECRTMGAGPIAGAAMAIVVCGDSSKSDVWVEDCSIAASFIQLQVAALNLGSCWIQIRNRFGAENISAEEALQELLSIPEHINIECVITVGHKAEERKPLDPEKCLWENVHVEKWTDRD